jgi:hypothetical protein
VGADRARARARAQDSSFEDWANLVWDQAGKMSLKNSGRTSGSSFGPLNSDAATTAVETLTLQHEGIVRDTGVKEPAET